MYLLSWKKITNIFCCNKLNQHNYKNQENPQKIRSAGSEYLEIRIITSEKVPLHTINTSCKTFSKKPQTLEHE